MYYDSGLAGNENGSDLNGTPGCRLAFDELVNYIFPINYILFHLAPLLRMVLEANISGSHSVCALCPSAILYHNRFRCWYTVCQLEL